MQRETRYDEIDRLLTEGQCFLIRPHPQAAALRKQSLRRLGIHDKADARRLAQPASQQAVIGAEIEGNRKSAMDRRRPLEKIIGHPLQQELVSDGADGYPVAPANQQLARSKIS